MTRRVLITGASGFVGQWLTRALLVGSALLAVAAVWQPVAASGAPRKPAPLSIFPTDAQTVADATQLADAAKKIHAKLDEDWRNIAVVRRDSQAGLDVVVPIRALSDWVQIRQRLGAIPAVKSVSPRTAPTRTTR